MLIETGDAVSLKKSSKERILKSFILISLFCTSAFASVIIPFEREASRLASYTYMTSENQNSDFYSDDFIADAKDNLYKQGFTIENYGPNEIVKTTPQGVNYAKRKFSFMTEDGARRDTYLYMTDYNGSGKVSDYFESAIVFLPRENQMSIVEEEKYLLVTLTTGEEIKFYKREKTLNSEVLQELPLDVNENRDQRKFAQLSYSGKGIMIRSDAKGRDPRLSPSVLVIKAGQADCKIAGKVFWTQEDFPKFKFASDEAAYAVIKEKCGPAYIP